MKFGLNPYFSRRALVSFTLWQLHFAYNRDPRYLPKIKIKINSAFNKIIIHRKRNLLVLPKKQCCFCKSLYDLISGKILETRLFQGIHSQGICCNFARIPKFISFIIFYLTFAVLQYLDNSQHNIHGKARFKFSYRLRVYGDIFINSHRIHWFHADIQNY